MPACLKTPYTGKVCPDTWFLHGTYKQDKLLTALYVHAIYVAHNTYRHSPDRGELRQFVHNIILDVPLKPNLRTYIKDVLQQSYMHT